MISRNNQARIERNQQKVDAGFMSKHYPEVERIVISMMYKQKGIGNPISRIMNFSPSSYAFFRVDCLSNDCVDGGFDLTHIINTMIRSQSRKVKGELGCVDSGTSPDHSGITYEVAIQYRIKKGFLKDGFELRESDGKGEGIFATRSFMAGEIVMNGIIEKVLEENHSHASQVGENDYVFHAGLISKVNHSCDPNCGIRVNETGAHDFVAIRDIIVNEEITFDYAMRNYGVDYFPKQCICDSERCRGRITGWKDLPDEKKKEYEGFVAPYLLVLDSRYSTN